MQHGSGAGGSASDCRLRRRPSRPSEGKGFYRQERRASARLFSHDLLSAKNLQLKNFLRLAGGLFNVQRCAALVAMAETS